MILSILAPRSLSFAPLVAGLIGYGLLSWKQRRPLPLDKNLGLYLGTIAALSLLTALWSLDPSQVISRSLNTAGLFLAGLFFLSCLSRQSLTKPAAITSIIVLYCLLGLYFYIDYLLHFPVALYVIGADFQSYNFNRGMVVFVLLLFPLLYLARKTFRGFAVVAVILACAFLPLSVTGSQTAQIALLGGFAGYGLFWLVKGSRARNRILDIFALAVCAGILCAPVIPGLLFKTLGMQVEQGGFAQNANLPGRLEIWNFVASKIREKPLLGHGIEATRNFQTGDMLMTYNRAHSILHPHNGPLQIWVELGLLGALLACAFAIFILCRIKKSSPAAQPLYCAVFLASLCLICTGYGLWQSWQLGLLLVMSGLCPLVTRLPDSQKTVI